MVEEIKTLRKKIEEIDKRLCELLEKRFYFSSEIGEYKKNKNLVIYDEKREQEIIESCIEQSMLSENFVRKFFEIIFNESKKIQMKIK